MYKKKGWYYMYFVLGESGVYGYRYSVILVFIVI